MIINEKQSNFLSNANFNETKMRMSDDPKLFMMLSSSIYEHKIRAVIRELSCNAQDSHLQAGVNTPFYVHLPTHVEPWFTVEDYGVGLSKEEVEDIYTVYGESTKTKTNILTGALGLGSKSPYSYSDMFEVRTRKNGIELMYLASKNEKLEFTFNLLYEKETTEPNGVMVKVPTIESDIREFRQEAANVFQFFREQPLCNLNLGIDNEELFNGIDEQGLYLEGEQFRINHELEITALMGNVAYDTSINENSFLRWCKSRWIEEYIVDGCYNHLRLYRDITIDFPMGSLEFMPSRERLSLTRDCLDALYTRIVEVFTPAINKIKDMIDGSRDIYEVYEKYINNGGVNNLVFGNTKYIYNNKEYKVGEISKVTLHSINNFNGDDDSEFNTLHKEDKLHWLFHRRSVRGCYNLKAWGKHSYSAFLNNTCIRETANKEALAIVQNRKSVAGINKYASMLNSTLIVKLLGREINFNGCIFLVSDEEGVDIIKKTTNLKVNLVSYSDVKALFDNTREHTERIKRENNEIKCVLFKDGESKGAVNEYTITEDTYYVERLSYGSRGVYTTDNKTRINGEALETLSSYKKIDIVVLNSANRVKLHKYSKSLNELFKNKFNELEYFCITNKDNVQKYIEVMTSRNDKYNVFSWVDESIVKHREENKELIKELEDTIKGMRFINGISDLGLESDNDDLFIERTGSTIKSFLDEYYEKRNLFYKEYGAYLDMIKPYGVYESTYNKLVHMISLLINK